MTARLSGLRWPAWLLALLVATGTQVGIPDRATADDVVSTETSRESGGDAGSSVSSVDHVLEELRRQWDERFETADAAEYWLRGVARHTAGSIEPPSSEDAMDGAGDVRDEGAPP